MSLFHLTNLSYSSYSSYSIGAYILSFLVVMETKIIFSNIYNCLNVKILTDIVSEHCLELNLLQLSHSMFCKNIAHLAAAREQHT